MKFWDRVLIYRRACIDLPALFLSGLFVAGCVNLAKPETVKTHCSAGSVTCIDNYEPDAYVPPDLGPDGQGDAGQDQKSDLAPPDEPPATDDVGPDIVAIPDSPADEATVNKDVGGTEVRDAHGSDTVEAPASFDDAPADNALDAEPAPEPSGAEPGPEPLSRGLSRDLNRDLSRGLSRDLSHRWMAASPMARQPPVRMRRPKTGSNGGGNSGNFNTTEAFCFVTCDTIANEWGCDNFTEAKRTVTVNGTAVKCAGTLPAKISGYYYFAIGAGGENWDAIHWSGTAATSCTPPAGGFVP
jgi:hypothetical protein